VAGLQTPAGMYAKAVQGMTPEDGVRWVEGELKRIYEA
jgi:hypothetical protein